MTDHHNRHRALPTNSVDAGILRRMIGLSAACRTGYRGATSAPLLCRAKNMDSLRCPGVAVSQLLIDLGLPRGRQREEIFSDGDPCAP